MNRTEIAALAREAGLAQVKTGHGLAGFVFHFAALVAAAEREACAQACVASDLIDWPTSVEVAAIRKCAAAIRARSGA